MKSVKRPHRSRPWSSPLSVDSHLSRRSALKSFGIASVALASGGLSTAHSSELYKVKNDRIHQSVVPWCFRPMPASALIKHSADMGLKSVELIGPEHWPTLKKNGMVCAIAGSHGFGKGFAHKDEHAECLNALRNRIDQCAEAGFPSVITFSGFRRKLSTEDGIQNMVQGLKAIAGYAETKNVTVCLEMLNSRVAENMKGHPDYFCDDMDLSIDILKQVSSDKVKVLFDIYHVQIMHGDIITRIRKYHEYIGHYHTAGVPGRNEIDDSQEINYIPIMKAILDTGYKGYVGQEFIPLKDKVTSLNRAVQLCDV